MNPETAQKMMEQLEATYELQKALGEIIIWGTVVALAFLFRNVIEDWGKCLLWKWVTGRDYKQDDVVIFDGQYGRIVRVGLFRTMLYIYHVDMNKDKIQIQTKRLIFNSEMKEHALEKPLDMLNIPKVIKQLMVNK